MDRQRKLQDYFYPHVPEGQGKPGNFQITDAKGVGEFVFYSEGAGHSHHSVFLFRTRLCKQLLNAY